MDAFRSRLLLPFPDGWFAKDSITLLTPDGQGNVIASSEPLDPSIDARQYAEVQGDLLRKEFDGYREQAFEPALVFGGRPGYVRRFSWGPRDSEPVTQIQVYFAANGRGYTATATTHSTNFEVLEPVFRSVLEGIMLAPEARD